MAGSPRSYRRRSKNIQTTPEVEPVEEATESTTKAAAKIAETEPEPEPKIEPPAPPPKKTIAMCPVCKEKRFDPKLKGKTLKCTNCRRKVTLI